MLAAVQSSAATLRYASERIRRSADLAAKAQMGTEWEPNGSLFKHGGTQDRDSWTTQMFIVFI